MAEAPAAIQTVLIYSRMVVVSCSGNEQGEVQEEPEEGDGLVRGKQEGDRIGGASRRVATGYCANEQGRARDGPKEKEEFRTHARHRIL